MDLLGQVGFSNARVVERFDCFSGTSKDGVAKKFGVRGVNVFALRE